MHGLSRTAGQTFIPSRHSFSLLHWVAYDIRRRHTARRTTCGSHNSPALLHVSSHTSPNPHRTRQFDVCVTLYDCSPSLHALVPSPWTRRAAWISVCCLDIREPHVPTVQSSLLSMFPFAACGIPSPLSLNKSTPEYAFRFASVRLCYRSVLLTFSETGVLLSGAHREVRVPCRR